MNDTEKMLLRNKNILNQNQMLLYVVKHSRQDIVNTTLELSKVIDGANQIVFLIIYHVIKYVLDTRNLGLNIQSNGTEKEPRNINCFRIILYNDSS